MDGSGPTFEDAMGPGAQAQAPPVAAPAPPPAQAAGDPLPAGARAVARGLRRPSLAPGQVAAVAMALDGAALALGLWFAGFAALGEATARAAGAAGLGAAGAVLLLAAAGRYRLGRLRRLWPGAAALLALALPLALALILAEGGPTTGLGALGAGALLVGLVLPARALGALLAGAALDFGLTERRAALVGGGEGAARVLAGLAATPGADVRVCGIFDDRDDVRSPPVVAGIPKLGGTADLVAFARAAEIDMAIVTLPLTADARIRGILKALEVLPLDLRLADFSADPSFRRRGTGLIAISSRPLGAGARAMKRALDVAGAGTALLVLAPLLLLTALLIRLESPGPVIFRQPRHGYNHRAVEVWKFRSMYAAACDPAARRIVTKGDPRVTRVGRWIRRLSIDELPQLWNVLRGDLSLVGPRPHALAAVSSRQESFEAIVDGYAARHKVRPGVTGWAQIHGWRGEIDDPEGLRRRVEHDLWYIENWSIWLDLYVLAVTPFRLLDSRGAY